MRRAGHVAHVGETGGAYAILVGRPEERRLLERPRHRWGIILKWIFKKWDARHGLD
jgi:hypothetical protein